MPSLGTRSGASRRRRERLLSPFRYLHELEVNNQSLRAESMIGRPKVSRPINVRNGRFSNSKPPTLLSLPIELRNEIFRYLLSTQRRRQGLGLGIAKYNLQPAILRTSTQIHAEELCKRMRPYSSKPGEIPTQSQRVASGDM